MILDFDIEKQGELWENIPQSTKPETRFYFILIGRKAIKVSGNWKKILEKEVHSWSETGLNKINAGQYQQCTATCNEMLWRGFLILEDTSVPRETYVHTIAPSNFKKTYTKAPQPRLEDHPDAVWL